MKPIIDNLEFPLLWIDHNKTSMGIYRDKEDLTTCGRGSEDFYENLILISSNEKKYTVLDAVKIGKLGGVSGLGFLKYFGVYEIMVKLNFSDKEENCSLISLKEMVLNILDEDEEYWDSDGRLTLVKEKVKQSDSVRTLIKIMKKRYFKESLI